MPRWRAHAAGVLDDGTAQTAAEAIHAREPSPRSPEAPRAAARRPQRSPDRQASIERRRHLAASGPMPPALAAKFTQAEMAAFRIVSDEMRHHGICALHIDVRWHRAAAEPQTIP